VVHLADELRLPLERCLQFRLVPRHRPGHPVEGEPQLTDFARRSGERRKVEASVPRLVGRDRPLHPGKRPQDQAVDDEPADDPGGKPHEDRQQRHQPFRSPHGLGAGTELKLQASSRDR
jgi:hypothetical protein